MMQSVTSFLCSLIKPFVSAQSSMIRAAPLVDGSFKLPKKTTKEVEKNGIIADTLWNLLNCGSIAPPAVDYCVSNDDCNAGERCKEGNCLTDPSHCSNAGCNDNYECN